MRTIFSRVAAWLIALSSPVTAAECIPPVFLGQPPTVPVIQEVAPPLFARPELPFCAKDYDVTGQHGCEDWEVAYHREAIELYVTQLRAYEDASREAARAAEAFADEARAYEERLEEFARLASEYLDCEVPNIRDEYLKPRDLDR